MLAANPGAARAHEEGHALHLAINAGCDSAAIGALLTADPDAAAALQPLIRKRPTFARQGHEGGHCGPGTGQRLLVGGCEVGVLCAPFGPVLLLFCTRITACYPDRAASGSHFVPGLPHIVAHSRRPSCRRAARRRPRLDHRGGAHALLDLVHHGPSAQPNRVLVCSALALNAMGQSRVTPRVTLLLR